jgi:spore maturation protein A
MWMVMSWIWAGSLVLSFICSLVLGKGESLAASIFQGAQAGVTLAVAMSGSLCLWAGVGKLLDAAGITELLSKLMKPVLYRLFPGTRKDPFLARSISGNICANFLGLGNAATPMGVQAAKTMKQGDVATDELCRLVVLNTASIQLIPSSVAAVRSALGCGTPFDILPAVWITSLCSAGLGVTTAWLLGKVWRL